MAPPRKRCKIIESSFEEVDVSSEDEEVKFSVPPSPTKKSTTPQQWLDKYQPKTVSEICINPTKLKQVKDSLRKLINHELKLLILTGPCGSSKSTSIRLLANEFYKGDIFNDNIIEYDESEKIGRFLQNCIYKKDSIILIDELPNVYHNETLIEFRDALNQWIFTNDITPPLVLCVSEYEYESDNFDKVSYSIDNNMTVDTLLGREFLASPGVEVIKFNSIAVRFLKKTVTNVLKNEELGRMMNNPKFDEFLQDLYKVGDIRSIIFNLELWVKFHKSGGDYKREDAINIFHAIGKIIYSSKEDIDPIIQVIERYPEKNSNLLNLGLLENYHIYQDSKFDIKIAEEICNDLSTNDIIQYGETGMRSTRLNLDKAGPITGTSKLKMKFPRHFKMLKNIRKTHTQINSYRRYITPNVSFVDLNLIDGYFLPQIYNKIRKTRYRYNRLGGKFLEVYADENTIDEQPITNYDYDQFQNDIDNKININDEEDELSDQIQESDSDDDFASDIDFDFLISQGKL
ncbi:rad17 [Candida pseudojiufengensis]|uniref:rad17 n=1 Tax=Candida pseudojiufengensis TaxID=497109 RepID=UPI002224FB65|nr:rad17 [Candida pseudojiufengensis]KAI5965697.1 rad17 [Candida pseudojiufengensis]